MALAPFEKPHTSPADGQFTSGVNFRDPDGLA
jgi:hypothetical protein